MKSKKKFKDSVCMVLTAGLTVKDVIGKDIEKRKLEEEHRKEIVAINDDGIKEIDALMKELFPWCK